MFFKYEGALIEATNWFLRAKSGAMLVKTNQNQNSFFPINFPM